MAKEMKMLGGYEIVDEKARDEIKVVEEKVNEAFSIAKGATRAFVYDTYCDMVSELNTFANTELSVNYHVMIRELEVPDLWVSGVSDTSVEYTYDSNDDFIADLTEDGIAQVGYFVLSALETQKVNLDDYVKNTDYATTSKVGLVKADELRGTTITGENALVINAAANYEIDAKQNGYKPITPSNLEYAVKKALSDCKLTDYRAWTDEEKQLARALLNAIGKEDYAKSNKAGVVKTALNFGIDATADGKLFIASASKDQIDNREYPTSNPNLWGYHPIVLESLDYAVKKALSDCKLTGDDVWTTEEKLSATTLLNALSLYNIGTGMRIDSVGKLMVDGGVVTEEMIKGKTYHNVAITPKTVDLAVKYGLADSKIEWTEEEKASARTTLGVDDLFAGAGVCKENKAPQYTKDGNLSVGTAKYSYEAVSKGYVDNLVGSVESILTELHDHAESLIGGEV